MESQGMLIMGKKVNKKAAREADVKAGAIIPQ
jgi:hypothetical protein